MSSKASEYGLSKQVHSHSVDAPMLSYLPPRPRGPLPKVGLIGAGGIAEYHLRAYQKLGLDVTMICDVDRKRAISRRDEFYPGAAVASDFHQVLGNEEITVVDVAVHPEHRVEIVEAAIRARKHVLSQKPFALDLDVAERLIELASRHGVRLAVNQNGRWAPHFAYARQAVRAGLLGEIGSVDFHLAFDHSWTVGTAFEKIHHLLLYDFGVHWFDMASCLLEPRKFRSVFASVARTSYQHARPPFLASVILDAGEAQVRMAFNAAVVHGQMDRTLIAGSLGTLESIGPSLTQQTVILTNQTGRAVPDLSGTWFENGFQGTMAELLCAIEDDREPMNSARDNLRTLELCFAALHSANTSQAVVPGKIRQLPSD